MQTEQTSTSFFDTFSNGVIHALQAISFLEVIAVLLGFAYLFLAMKENSLCWYAAFGSTAIYSWIFFDVSLVMESALNVYYLGMAIYGWLVWNKVNSTESTQTPNDSKKLKVTTWSIKQHLASITGVIALSLLSGYFLNNHTTAVMPYLDSFTTWGAVLTTYMVAKKVLENWVYWIVIDTLAIYLYIDRELYLVALQMAVYVILCFIGFNAWLKSYQSQTV